MDNLGVKFGLVAAAALMIDYVLTAAVSLTAGVEAIASAFPELLQHRVAVTLLLLAVITLINLRGATEAGTVMAVPVYLFLFVYLGMLGIGLWKAWTHGTGSLVTPAPTAIESLTVIVLMRALASGTTALTGIEAMSNGVPAFKPPESRNVGRTLIVMAVLMSILFLGSLGLTHYFAVMPRPDETILSALARRLVGNGFFYYLVQFSTLMILVVAANTSFSGFPWLASILARDKLLPRQLANLSDRLVFTNGMLLLAGATAVLVVVFGGVSHALIPLFAVGAFMAFTLSQAGMVLHWARLKGGGWWLKLLLNGLGALGTGVMLVVVGISKFTHGAWLTLLVIPLLVWMFLRIHDHFAEVARELTLRGLPPSLKPVPRLRLVVPISGVHRGTVQAINYARSISDQITVFYLEIDPGSSAALRTKWEEWFPDIPLVIVPSPYRSLVAPLLEFLDRTDEEHNDGQLAAVVLPEIVPARGWQALLHNQGAWLVRTALLYRRRNLGYQRLIIDVPYHLKR